MYFRALGFELLLSNLYLRTFAKELVLPSFWFQVVISNFTSSAELVGLLAPKFGRRIFPRSNSWLQTNPKRTPKNPSEPPANRSEPAHGPQLRQTFAIKHDSQAFFLKAKAVRKLSTVQCRVHFGRLTTKEVRMQLQYTADCTSAGGLSYRYR